LSTKSTWRGLNKTLRSPNPSSSSAHANAHGGASGSGTLSHGVSAHGQKRKIPPHEQKKNYSWINAKEKIFPAEFRQRLKTGSCICCGEQGHNFKACTKLKPSSLLMGIIDNDVIVSPCVKPHYSITSNIKGPKCASNTKLYSNAWRLIDSEFDKLNALFSFTLEECCDPERKNKHGLLPFYFENNSLLSHEVIGQYVFCSPPWSLVVQCV
jgi:hypothetical protein